MKIVFAAGGSGGHLYPALSTAEEFKKGFNEDEIVFFGRRRSLEERVAKKNGYRFCPVFCGPLPEKLSLQIFPFLVKSVAGIVSSHFLLLKVRPRIVVGFGGYVSAPVVVSAALLNIPVLIHEQNLVPGRANRFLFRFAAKVAFSFSESQSFLLPRISRVVTGNPVRSGILRKDRGEGLDEFGLDPGKFTVLILGGSHGSQVLNRTAVQAFSALEKKERNHFQVVHLTGKHEYEDVKTAYRGVGIECRVFPFLEEMAPAYGCCDLIICRSGASTVAEITARGVPAILIPYQYAGGHQLENARYLEKNGACVVLEEKDISGDVLMNFMIEISSDTRRCREMSESSRHLGRPEAAKNLAAAISGMTGSE